ncbi:LacI family DNA-binding transcriptional regulator [candidate division KSB1 bacterium]|nr:LacI family DNA-binding transcriptional regulator [candidate division KSB1 bacterium]
MATIKDIAKLANVSIGTVDRVLHNRGFVSPETRQRVKQVIQELNYSPNIYARQLKLARHYKFGVLMPELHQDANYWERPAIGMRDAARELEAHKIEVKFFFFDRYSEDSFNEKCNQLLDDDPDGLLIAPILINPARQFVHSIPKKIPYIFFDSDIPQTNRLTFIGQDPNKSGILAGKLMKMLIGNRGDIGIIRVLPEDYHIDQRITGFQSFFQENGEAISIRVFEWQENEDLSSINALINKIVKNDDLRGIFISNALTYLVASQIELLKYQNRIKIIGYDLVQENVEFLKKSIIDFLISQSPVTQGYQGIKLLYKKLVLNQDVEDMIMMPIDIITKENVDFNKYISRENMIDNYSPVDSHLPD